MIYAGAAGAQITFTEINGGAPLAQNALLTESLAWGDYDRDGDEDLYLTVQGDNVLLRNDGGTFTDVTAAAGVGDSGWGVGTGFADLDNDGDLDLYVVNFGADPDRLYRNNGPNANPIFTEIGLTAGIASGTESSRGMAFIDFDRDGLLDIYVNAIGDDLLYHNQGGLQFINVAASVGISGNDGQGVGVVATDIDNDGWVDLFTGNRSGQPNRLFRNLGGSFMDITSAAGIDRTGLGMGVLSFDYDNDGAMDLYWTAWPDAAGSNGDNALYRNQGGAVFTDLTSASGAADASGWGISGNTADIDRDGWEDFFITNGFSDDSTANVLFHNNAAGGFSDISSLLPAPVLFDGRGAAFADYDNDGDDDLLVTTDIGLSNRLWRNDSVNSNHWIKLILEGTQSNRSAIGARVEITTDTGTIVREVSGGAGRGSFNSLPLLIGLGSASQINQLLIRWPNGQTEIIAPPAMDQVVTLIEGTLMRDGFE
ncbi:MAG: hypothetical protein Tsb002_28020 [Wenzhouxiangellaceae bacterium]